MYWYDTWSTITSKVTINEDTVCRNKYDNGIVNNACTDYMIIIIIVLFTI